MKHRILWLSMIALFVLSISQTKVLADSITLLPGTSQTINFALPGKSGIAAQAVFTLNATGNQLTFNVTNLTAAGSGIDIIGINYIAANPNTFTSTNAALTGAFLTQSFVGAGQTGGAITTLSRNVTEGFLNPTYRIVFRLADGSQVTAFGTLAEVPEPASLLLMGTGLVGIAARIRNRKKAKSGI